MQLISPIHFRAPTSNKRCVWFFFTANVSKTFVTSFWMGFQGLQTKQQFTVSVTVIWSNHLWAWLLLKWTKSNLPLSAGRSHLTLHTCSSLHRSWPCAVQPNALPWDWFVQLYFKIKSAWKAVLFEVSGALFAFSAFSPFFHTPSLLWPHFTWYFAAASYQHLHTTEFL